MAPTTQILPGCKSSSSSLDLVDIHWALILPGLISACGVFMLRQHFMTLPGELMDAAKIDGPGFFRIYWSILLPMVRPALATLAFFRFLTSRHNFYGPHLSLRSWDKYTLPLATVLLQGYMGSGSIAEILADVHSPRIMASAQIGRKRRQEELRDFRSVPTGRSFL